MNSERIKQGLEIHLEMFKKAIEVYSNGTEEQKEKFFKEFFGLDNK